MVRFQRFSSVDQGHGLKDRMMRAPQLLLSNPDGWRMAGPGGFRRFPNGIIESYGGPGLFWYAQEIGSSRHLVREIANGLSSGVSLSACDPFLKRGADLWLCHSLP